MSRPIGCSACSCWRTFPRNSSLSLMSSTYLTCPPYRRSNVLSTFLSMYSGQLENVQLPMGTFGCVISGIGVACLDARSSVPSIPQPASEEASASEPARPRKRRRVSATLDHEGVLRLPGQLDLASDREALGLGAVGVLREDVELLAARGLDHVLDRDAEEGRDEDLAAQDV